MTIINETDLWPVSKSGDTESAIALIMGAISKWKESNMEPPTHIAIPLEFKRLIADQFESSFSLKIPRGAPDEIAGLKVIWSTGIGCTMELLRA